MRCPLCRGRIREDRTSTAGVPPRLTSLERRCLECGWWEKQTWPPGQGPTWGEQHWSSNRGS